jgi:PAS domain S-box-containing protein
MNEKRKKEKQISEGTDLSGYEGGTTNKRLSLEEYTAKLSNLRHKLLAENSLSNKLKIITDNVVEVFDTDFARIWITRDADLCERGCSHARVTEGPEVCRNRIRCLHLMTSSGRYTHINGSHRRVPFGAYKIGRVASGEDPKFITNDVANDPRVHDHEWAKSLGLVSFAGFQLVCSEGKTIGVFALFSKRSITGYEEKLLEDIADTTSQVIITGLAEEALNQSEERFRSFFEKSILGITLTTLDGNVITTNKAMQEMLGYSEEEFKRISASSTYQNPDERERVLSRLQKDGFVSDFEVVLKRATGELIEVLMSMTRTKIGETELLQTSFIDITARKRAEAGLKNTNSLLRATLESTMDGILVVDHVGNISSYNEQFAQMWNIPGDIIATRNDEAAIRWVLAQLQDPEGFVSRVRDLYTNPEADSFDILLFKDGRVFERYSHPQRIDGRPVGRVWSFRDVTKSTKAEETLRENEERFRRIFNEGPLGMATAGVDLLFTKANASFCNMMGYEESELSSLTFKALTHPDDIGTDMHNITRLLKKEISLYRAEKRYIRKDKNIVWGAVTVSVIRNSIGQFQYYLIMIEDISERKRAEEALRVSRESYRTLVENAVLGLYRTSPDGFILMANPALCRMLGYSSFEELRQLNLEGRSFNANYSRSVFKREIDNHGMIAGLESTWTKKDGTKIFVRESAKAIRNTWGDILYFEGTVEDITEHIRAEEELHNSEERYRITAQQTGQLIYDYNIDAGIIKWAGAIQPVTGYEPEEFQESTLPEWENRIHPDDRQHALSVLDEAQKTGSQYVVEYRFRRKDGEYIYIEDHGAFLKNEQGIAYRMLGTMADISELRKRILEQQRLTIEVQQALEEVRTLSGLLPICANCKKIRDDKGYWTQIEAFIQERSGARFSHGVCPDCKKILYPDLKKNK